MTGCGPKKFELWSTRRTLLTMFKGHLHAFVLRRLLPSFRLGKSRNPRALFGVGGAHISACMFWYVIFLCRWTGPEISPRKQVDIAIIYFILLEKRNLGTDVELVYACHITAVLTSMRDLLSINNATLLFVKVPCVD